MPSGGFFDRRPRSRPSLTNVGQMPVISEDGDATANGGRRAAARDVPRLPQKSTRRYMLGRGRGQRENRPDVPQQPSFVPALHLPPRGRSKNKTRLAMNGAALKKDGMEGGEKEFAQKKGLFSSKKMRWGLIILAILLLVGLIVGLAVGLTVGKKKDKHNSADNDTDTDAVGQVYPAGSYTFNTTLQQNSTACTSNASTWRCTPYQQGGEVTLFWTVTALSNSTFNISTTDNVFAIRFANQTTTLLDAGQPTERLAFALQMNRTVLPDASLTSDNRAARCTFVDTTFAATLWTRRSDNQTISPPEGKMDEKFGAWPGDIEVTQSADAKSGSPSCEDLSGNAITSVKAGPGECLCRYASFDLK